jgi:hypothetical protein
MTWGRGGVISGKINMRRKWIALSPLFITKILT